MTLVRPGEACAHDGVVVWGTGLVSAEHITGEALPRRAKVGDALPAGTLSRDGALALRCTAAAKDSAPARIAALAAAAQRSKPPLAAWLDEVGAVYSRGVLVASLVAFLVLLALGVPLGSCSGAGAALSRGAAYRAMALLTAASPCALALAPLAYVAAVATAARRGVVLRGGGATLDALLEVRGVGLDKTGTLTTGELRCVGQVGVGENSSSSSSSSLATAAALALRSTHPVSAALVAAAKGAGVEPLAPAALSAFELVPGSGVKAKLLEEDKGGERGGSATVFLGSADWVAAALAAEGKGGGASAAAAALLAAAAETEAGAVIVSAFAKISSNPSSSSSPPPQVSLFAFEDAVRALSSSAVASLRSGGAAAAAAGEAEGGGGSKGQRKRARRAPLVLRVLTGDNAASASRVARSLGIAPEDLRSGLSPAGKVEALRELRAQVNPDAGEGGTRRKGRGKGGGAFGVMMFGDGGNDAPALAAADVGVALSSSSSSSNKSSNSSSSSSSSSASTTATAQELAADVLLLGGAGIEQLPFLLDLAALTRSVVRQNLAVAAGSVAVLALPALCGWLPLWLAVALHEGSTLVVALNSLRPLAFRGEKGGEEEKRRRAGSSPSSSVDLSSAAVVAAAAAAAAAPPPPPLPPPPSPIAAASAA